MCNTMELYSMDAQTDIYTQAGNHTAALIINLAIDLYQDSFKRNSYIKVNTYRKN